MGKIKQKEIFILLILWVALSCVVAACFYNYNMNIKANCETLYGAGYDAELINLYEYYPDLIIDSALGVEHYECVITLNNHEKYGLRGIYYDKLNSDYVGEWISLARNNQIIGD